MTQKYFPAEWAPQSAILMAWPHANTDWADILDEVQNCFTDIINSIVKFQKVLLLVQDEKTGNELAQKFGQNLIIVVAETNDTWARDFGPITIFEDDQPVCLDFKFNGWGLKFAADKDNLITEKLFQKSLFSKHVKYKNRLNFVLEGGALETDGMGTLLTTSECLLSPNRNGQWNKEQIEAYLIQELGLKRVLWLNYGYLAGDDTDSHIDTLARFCNADTIAYVKCTDTKDEHFQSLNAMEEELQALKTKDGKPYQLIPLPMAQKVIFDDERLPATYANFLIINDAVLMPTYDSELDEIAISQLQKAFPDRQIIGINCLPLIKQHGSLHCVTMQLPLEVI